MSLVLWSLREILDVHVFNVKGAFEHIETNFATRFLFNSFFFVFFVQAIGKKYLNSAIPAFWRESITD